MLIAFLRLFHEITEAEMQLIEAVIEERHYKEGEYLLEPDTLCDEFFFIAKGVLRIAMDNEKGNRVIHFFLKENQFCTILNSFNNGTIASESIEAACDVDVLVFKRDQLLQLYTKIPYLKTVIDQINQQALLDKIAIRNGYLGHDSSKRYELFMMRQPEVALRVSLGDIASYLGITPQSLSRIRRNIK